MKMETLETKLKRVKKEKRARRLDLKVKRAMWQNSIAKEILDTQDVMVTYVRDKFGFKKGVIIAIDAGQLGWSLVDQSDYEYRDLTIEQIPALESYIHTPETFDKENTIDGLVNHPAFKAWSRQGGCIRVPRFDRAQGIVIAMDRARTIASIESDKGLNFTDTKLPYDKEFLNTLARMNLRSYRHFGDGSTTEGDEPEAK